MSLARMLTGIIHGYDGMVERLRNIEIKLDKITETMMIDTSKMLSAVAAEKTKVDSLIALSNTQSQTMKDLSKQLADAIAANDPTALAQVQTDLDKAATDLTTENQSVDDAINANITA